jgi:hypothetical protein
MTAIPGANQMDEHDLHDDEETGPIGIFPSWKVLYWSVVIFTLALIVVLAVFTETFNYSVR